MNISRRARKLQPSPLQEFFRRAKAMSGVLSFGVGETVFPSPDIAKDAAKLAIESDFTRYTPAIGIMSLREAAVADFQESGISASVNDTIIGPGSKSLLTAALWATCNSGDEVLVPGPYYPPFWDLVNDLGAKPILIDTAPDGFVLRAERVRCAKTQHTKAIILNSPNNPTGMVWDLNELNSACDDILVISDESYNRLVFSGSHASIIAKRRENANTITIRSCSKAFAMTGWRIGYLNGPRHIVEKIQLYLEMAVGCPCAVSQKTALVALVNCRDYAKNIMLPALSTRKKQLAAWLTSRNIPFPASSGAFYMFPDFSQFKMPSLALANLLLEKAKVATTPGIAFGPYDSFLRMSYASLSSEEMREALGRIDKALDGIVVS